MGVFPFPMPFSGPPKFGSFSPLALFAASEPGGWYDPSDLTTLFQDAAGTTPVTAVEQPVGLVLDKSRGLVLGSEAVVTGTAPWARGFLSVDGTISASGSAVTITQGAGDSASFRWVQPVACVVGRYYRLTIASFSRSGGTAAQLGLSANSSGTGMSATNSFTDTAGFTTIYVAATAATMYVTISFAGGSTGNSATFTGISVRELPGNHLSQSTSTARPVLKQDANGCYYLLFDGTDDFLVSGTIKPGSVDKAQVFAGVRKLSDVVVGGGVVVELSATSASNNGSFVLQFPGGTNLESFWRSKGTSDASGNTTGSSAAPYTAVARGIGDISGDVSELWQNGVRLFNSTSDQGTGTYGSYPLYIGRRGGTSGAFNGHLYSLILRFSATNLDAATIAATETWVNQRTKAY